MTIIMKQNRMER